MNYQSIYDQLVIKFKESKPVKNKTNGHHIIPRCFERVDNVEDINGEWNIVHLPHREHFFAHLLLARIWRHHPVKGAMTAYAFTMMSECRKLSSKNYSWIKSTLDYSRSNETKRKISRSKKGTRVGIRLSEDHKKKIGKALIGKKRSSEFGQKMSEIAKKRNIIMTDEMKQKLAESRKHLIGKPLSEETKQKIREARKSQIITDEAREKMRLAKIGTRHSEETKKKMSAARLGKKRGPYKKK